MESNSHANKGFQAPSLNTKGDDKLFYGTQSWLKQPIQNRFSSCGVLLPQAIIAPNTSNQLKKKKKLCLKLDIYVRNIRKPQTTVNFSKWRLTSIPNGFFRSRFRAIYADLWNDICDNFYPIFIVCVGLRQKANMDPREMQTIKKGKQVFLRSWSYKKKHVDRSSYGRGQTTGESDQASQQYTRWL